MTSTMNEAPQDTHFFDANRYVRPTIDGKWRRQRCLLARARRRHPAALTPRYERGRIIGYDLPRSLYEGLWSDERPKPPLKMTKANLSRSLYCLNKHAKLDHSLYEIKDQVLRKLLSLGWASITEYHSTDRQSYDEDGGGWYTAYYELIAFGPYTFHRPASEPPAGVAVKDLGDGWMSPRGIEKCKPVDSWRASELLRRFLHEATAMAPPTNW